MYKHVYRLSGRPKFESLSTESVSVGLPTRIQENVIFCHNLPPTLWSPSDMQLFDPFFTYLWFQNLALSYISRMTSSKYLSLTYQWNVHGLRCHILWSLYWRTLGTLVYNSTWLKKKKKKGGCWTIVFPCCNYIRSFAEPFLGFSLKRWCQGFQYVRLKIYHFLTWPPRFHPTPHYFSSMFYFSKHLRGNVLFLCWYSFSSIVHYTINAHWKNFKHALSLLISEMSSYDKFWLN